MIISEKQIMELMQLAENYCDLLYRLQNEQHTEYSEEILKLIFTIKRQQSEELKVVE